MELVVLDGVVIEAGFPLKERCCKLKLQLRTKGASYRTLDNMHTDPYACPIETRRFTDLCYLNGMELKTFTARR